MLQPKRKEMQYQDGAITVFLAVIFLAFLLLAGTFIDIARILVAERKVQSALNTSIRSVLSDYDKNLISDYSIFGLNTADKDGAIELAFQRYMTTNLKERSEGINFIHYEINPKGTTIIGMGSLVQPEILKKQILEVMKYKAPISITENLIQKFQPLKLDSQAEDFKNGKISEDDSDENSSEDEDKDPPKTVDKPYTWYSLLEQIEDIKKKLLLNKIENEWLISKDEFAKAKLADDKKFEVMSSSLTLDYENDVDQAKDRRSKIAKQIKQLTDAISQATVNGRDKILIIEYVMDRFNYFTLNAEKNHFFKKGEIEYILCGEDIGNSYNQILNTEAFVVADVIGQMWLIRYAIDTVDAFVTSKIPHPLVRVVEALVDGLAFSCKDMYQLLNGEDIAICPSIKGVKLIYEDHLRLMLLMRSEKVILRRIMQLMQVNIKQVTSEDGKALKDFKLSDCNTYIQIKAEVRINLVFLPVLGVDKLMKNKCEQGKYIITKDMIIGY